MSTVRAKFICQRLMEQENEIIQASFVALIDGNEENNSFSKYTPSGNLVLDISKGTLASNIFIEGEEYYLDITPAKGGVKEGTASGPGD
jgi:hypothetical protein